MTAESPQCPTCSQPGALDGDMHRCSNGHRFWAATRRCECGGIPVCPERADIWECPACGQWELVAQ